MVAALAQWAGSNGFTYQPQQRPTFAEPQNGYEMSMGGLLTLRSGTNLIAVALGVALSSFVAGWVGNFLPFGTGGIPKIIVGFVLMKWVLKTGWGYGFAVGIMLAGIAELASGLVGGFTGMFGQPNPSINNAMRGAIQGGTAYYRQPGGQYNIPGYSVQWV